MRETTFAVGLTFVDIRAAEAVLEFLGTTSVGCIGADRVPPEDWWEDSDGAEGGLGLP